MIDNTQWVDVPRFKGEYQVNKSGQIKSVSRIINRGNGVMNIKERIYTNGLNPNGYPYVYLKNRFYKKGIAIHRLLAEMFIPNPDNKPCVNHKDGNKLNYALDNLEWATYSENNFHAYATGLKTGRSQMAVVQLLHDGSKRTFKSITEASKILGINKSNIASVCKGRKSFYTAGGYCFRYEHKQAVA